VIGAPQLPSCQESETVASVASVAEMLVAMHRAPMSLPRE
jgi:hypothetical protein